MTDLILGRRRVFFETPGGEVLLYLTCRDVPLNRVSFCGKNHATGCPFLIRIMRQGITID